MGINTKAGETVPVPDTAIGDDTGEIRLVAWRDSSNLLKRLRHWRKNKVLKQYLPYILQIKRRQ